MEELDAIRGETIEARAELSLSLSAAIPGPRRLGLIGQREDQAAKARVSLSDPALATTTPMIGFALRGRPWAPGGRGLSI